jgi:nitrogen-specific signal transduction histidine kinase/ActR/RegA family two-component response regulator
VLAAGLDVTDRRHAETQAAALREELAHLGRVTMLDALAGSLAHEINQPLTAVMANTEAALQLVASTPLQLEELRETLTDILSDNKRAGEVVWRMASMLKKGTSQYEPVDVNRTVSEVITLVQSNKISRRISLDVQLDAGIVPVWGDRIQIQQVVLNLLVNAFDAVAECAPANRRVRIQTLARDRAAVIEVSDVGAGLSGDALAAIFEPFYTTKPDGLGLGLWICRGIVAAHGGTLEARRNPGPGMTFSTTLPAARANEDALAREERRTFPCDQTPMISQTATRTHAAQFYEGEPQLHLAIVAFFTEPMRMGHHTLMICRRHTFEAVVEHLRAAGDAALAEGAGLTVFVDVEEAVNGFMVGTRVNPVLLEQALMELMARVRGTGDTPVWVYGEMAGWLCSNGNQDAATSLEELWNVHFPEPEFKVLCGYAIEDFDRDEQAHAFRAICRQHTHVGLLQPRARTSSAVLNLRLAAGENGATSDPMVCVIDDDPSVRRSLSRLLVLAGCEVRVFASADEFLDDPGRSQARCLILDVQLIGLSSQELQVRLAEEPGAVPVIAMSGSHDPQVQTEALRLGAAAFLRKPFEAKKLVEAIARVIYSRK